MGKRKLRVAKREKKVARAAEVKAAAKKVSPARLLKKAKAKALKVKAKQAKANLKKAKKGLKKFDAVKPRKSADVLCDKIKKGKLALANANSKLSTMKKGLSVGALATAKSP